MNGGRAPSGKGGDGGKKSSGGLWGVVSKILDNASLDVNLGAGAPAPRAPRAPSGNAADPAARMEPVKQDRKETYDEMIYRTTDGERGQAPIERIDRERRFVARSLDTRGASARATTTIPEGGGEPLSKDVRNKMEPKLGGDLSDVRVHRSGESAEAAQHLNAKAFTVGRDVHFGGGNYSRERKKATVCSRTS